MAPAISHPRRPEYCSARREHKPTARRELSPVSVVTSVAGVDSTSDPAELGDTRDVDFDVLLVGVHLDHESSIRVYGA